MKNFILNRMKLDVSPWLFLGVVFLLVLIIALMASQNINARRQSSLEEMLAKGVAIMRSVEAGSRSSMYAMPWGNTQLQRLLEESAMMPEVLEICITDASGFILSSSDAQRIGQMMPRPQIPNLPPPGKWNKDDILWEILSPQGDGGTHRDRQQRIMHIFGRFEAAPKKIPLPQKNDLPPAGKPSPSPGFNAYNRSMPQEVRLIHVYLSMDTMDLRARNMAMNMIVSSFIIFGGGLACFIIMLIFQNYRSAKASLRKIQLFTDNVVNKMPIGLAAFDSNGTVVNFNHAAEEILRLSAAETLGKNAKNLLPETFLSGPMAKGKTYEAECLLKNNKSIFLEITKSILQDENHEAQGIMVLFRDLTEIKTLQREIMLNQHMASIGRFAAGIAHEIRNPLSSIKGFASYFKNRYKDVENDVKIAEIMISETERLNRVITQLLEFARPIHVRWTAVDTIELIKDSLTLIAEPAKEHKVELIFETPADLPDIKTDPDRVRQVLLNLYLNSIDAMPDGGSLTVATAFNADTAMLKITVSDTGKGIAPENLEKIFDPYFTTKPTGTGLGLGIVANTMEALQGRIQVESDANGTVFILHLPLKPVLGINIYEDNANE